MQYNVSQFLRGPVGDTRTFPVEGDLDGVDDSRRLAPVTGSVEMVRTNQGILARVVAALSSIEECSRCLVMLEQPLTVVFEEVFYPTIDPVSGYPLPPPPETDPFLIDHNHLLDLSNAIREYAVMARPIQPLCRSDCAGLCPRCGVNRNEVTCSCVETAIDPRWAALGQLHVLE